MIRTASKILAIAFISLFLIPLASALLYRTYVQRRIANSQAILSPPGIASLEPVQIGGIRQWIEVRGDQVSNPILLVIHGGPGIAFIPLARAFQGPWEKYFTVAEWDQRGAGKTYASNERDLQRRTMSVSRMQEDTLEVVNYLRSRFQRKKIFVLGHSWGSVLGLWLAHEHPDMLYAYIGVGQLINTRQNQEAMYRDALQRARDRRDQKAEEALDALAPYPPPAFDFEKDARVNMLAGALLSPSKNGPAFVDVRRLLTDLLSAPEYSLVDAYGFVRGQQLSLQALIPQMQSVDLRELGPVFRTPIFFFEGREDPFCRPALVWEYSQAIQAPRKEFVWFDQAGHFPFYEEPQKFVGDLVQRVLPLADERVDH